jgi:hypothetical protein
MQTILAPFHIEDPVDGLPFPDALILRPGAYPAAGGPPLATLVSALRRLSDTGRVVGIGLACTFAPERAAAEQVTHVLDAVLAAVIGKKP